jgi:hypothetical protein
MAEKKTEPKRHNRFVGLDVAANGVLDPVFRKRGFANRDLFARWSEIAPPPFGATTVPERLYWPRRETGAEGAIVFLRCAPGTALAVSHEGERIAQAVNRYFGYFLVRAIKISVEPFVPQAPVDTAPPQCPPEIKADVGRMVETVGIDALREALRSLGENLKSRQR